MAKKKKIIKKSPAQEALEKKGMSVPLPPLEPVPEVDTAGQSLVQKKMILAASSHAPVIIELLKDCRTEVFTVVEDTEFKTLVNALRLEFEAELIKRVVVYLEEIRKGKLHGTK